MENYLYLTEESRRAFYEAYHAAVIRPDLYQGQNRNWEEIKQNFETIRKAGPIIVEAVSLPSWGDKEYSPIKNQ